MTLDNLPAIPTIDEIETAIGVPAEQWRGECYAVASIALKSGVFDKMQAPAIYLEYGMWHGPIEQGSQFHGRLFTGHGWLAIYDERGRWPEIVDLTRWEFEQVQPYIYAGRNDFYDLGGVSIHMPAPACEPAQNREPLPADPLLTMYILDELGCTCEGLHISPAQMYWIASQTDPRRLGLKTTIKLYDWLIDRNAKAAIPIDLWTYVDDRRSP